MIYDLGGPDRSALRLHITDKVKELTLALLNKRVYSVYILDFIKRGNPTPPRIRP